MDTNDHKIIIVEVKRREASGKRIGTVTRLIALSPDTSAKSCTCIVVRMIMAERRTESAAVLSRELNLPEILAEHMIMSTMREVHTHYHS